MDRYLVKSTKWTEHNSYTTWWGPDRSGYTPLIRQAGVYTEAEARSLESTNGSNVCVAVRFDEELFQNGLEEIKGEIKFQEEEKERYMAYAANIEREAEEKKALLEKYIDTMAIK